MPASLGQAVTAQDEFWKWLAGKVRHHLRRPNLSLDVVAEGIETAEVWSRVRAMGCAYGQGYLAGRPMPVADVQAWLEATDGRIPSPHPQPLALRG